MEDPRLGRKVGMMTRSLWRSVVVLVAGGLALTTLATPGDAAKPKVGRSVAVYNQAETDADAAAVAAKWTPAAMRSAIPLDTLILNKAKKLTSKVAAGKPQVVRPTAGSGGVTAQSIPNGGSAWAGGGAVTKTIGRVFVYVQRPNASCIGV